MQSLGVQICVHSKKQQQAVSNQHKSASKLLFEAVNGKRLKTKNVLSWIHGASALEQKRPEASTQSSFQKTSGTNTGRSVLYGLLHISPGP